MKPRSPSKGPLTDDYRPAELARAYQGGGAHAVSVLTHEAGFGGSPDHLAVARAACELPVLRKDFVVDEYQILEARALGADALLLIVAALAPARLAALLARTRACGMEALVEVHDEREVDVALEAGADVIGVNHRDLRDFSIDRTLSARLRGGSAPGGSWSGRAACAAHPTPARWKRPGWTRSWSENCSCGPVTPVPRSRDWSDDGERHVHATPHGPGRDRHRGPGPDRPRGRRRAGRMDPGSWRSRPAAQQPEWPDPGELRGVEDTLALRPPLVLPDEILDLRRSLAQVAAGRASCSRRATARSGSGPAPRQGCAASCGSSSRWPSCSPTAPGCRW